MNAFKISRGAKFGITAFVIYFLLIFFSAGDNNSIPTIIGMATFSGAVIASIVYTAYNLCVYIANLVKR